MTRLGLAALLLLAGCSSSHGVEPLPDEAVACARLSACADFEFEDFGGVVGGYDACVLALSSSDALGAIRPPLVDCVLAASDCSAALTCIHAPDAAECTSTRAECEGDVLRDCAAGVEIRRDCAAEGLTCVDNGNLACGAEAGCTESRCEGDRLFICAGDREVAIDCEPGHCHVDAETGFASCLAGLEPCERGMHFCDGDVAVSCVDGYIRRSLCLPGQCSESDGAFCRVDETCESSCEGQILLACVGNGRTERVDCAEWGGSGCVNDGSGARCAR